jgi:hypothetical protein
MRTDAYGAAFVGGGDESEQQLGSGVVEWGEAKLVDLCRYRLRSTYTDTATMPTTGLMRLSGGDVGGSVVGIVIGCRGRRAACPVGGSGLV